MTLRLGSLCDPFDAMTLGLVFSVIPLTLVFRSLCDPFVAMTLRARFQVSL